MKKGLMLAMLMAFTAVCFAQSNQAPAQTQEVKPQEKAAPQKVEKKEIKKVMKKEMKKVETITGEIINVSTDPQKSEITVKIGGKKENVEKTIAVDPKELANLKVGEKVKIKMVNDKVESIKKIEKHETHHKKEMKKKMKKEEVKKEENKPQTQPAEQKTTN